MFKSLVSRTRQSRFAASAALAFAVFFGLDYAAKADVIVSDLGGQLRRFDDSGNLLQTVSGGSEGLACATIGGVHELFVANNTGTITIYNPANLAVIGSYTIPGGVSLAALSLSADGLRLYAADYGANKIWILNTTPVLGLSTLPALSTNASHDVAVSPIDGAVYTAHFQPPNNALGVVKFTPIFTGSTLTGYSGPAPFIPSSGANGLTNPGGLVVDKGNNIWVSNFSGSSPLVNKYDAVGSWKFTVGPTGANPIGLALGPGNFSSDIYVAELASNTIGKITQTSPTSGTRSLFINSPDAGSQPKYLQFKENCITATGCGPNPLQTLVGTWIFSAEGFSSLSSAFGPAGPFASAGQFVASIGSSGGRLSITSTANINGQIVHQETDIGSFQIFPDCTGGTLTFNLSTRPVQFDFWFTHEGNGIRFVSTTPGVSIRGRASRGGTTCPIGINPLGTFVGRWVYSMNGFTPTMSPFASAGQFTANIGIRGGNQIGVLAVTSTADLNDSVVRLETDAGTYQIFPDCSGGTLTFNLSTRPMQFDFWFAEGGTEIRFVSTTPAIVVSGSAELN